MYRKEHGVWAMRGEGWEGPARLSPEPNTLPAAGATHGPVLRRPTAATESVTCGVQR